MRLDWVRSFRLGMTKDSGLWAVTLLLSVQSVQAELVNIALGKSSGQSSTDSSSSLPNLGVDGSLETSTGTEVEENPWWYVDLGEPYDIHSIVIYPKRCTASITKMLVFTTDSFQTPSEALDDPQYQCDDVAYHTSLTEVTCSKTARFVTLSRGRLIFPPINLKSLCLYEVQVYQNITEEGQPLTTVETLAETSTQDVTSLSERVAPTTTVTARYTTGLGKHPTTERSNPFVEILGSATAYFQETTASETVSAITEQMDSTQAGTTVTPSSSYPTSARSLEMIDRSRSDSEQGIPLFTARDSEPTRPSATTGKRTSVHQLSLFSTGSSKDNTQRSALQTHAQLSTIKPSLSSSAMSVSEQEPTFGSGTTTSVIATSYPPKSCPCRCTMKSSTQPKLTELMKQILSQLDIPKSNFSQTKRRYNSAPDDRLTSKFAGSASLILLAVLFSLIFVADLISIVKNV